MVVVVNCLMAIPFLLRILLPTLNSAITDFGKLSQSLGFTEWQFLKLVILPKLAQPLGFSFGLAAAISVGDFGVIALFSLSDNVTLPMTLYSFMGAYRVHEAAATATTNCQSSHQHDHHEANHKPEDSLHLPKVFASN